MGAGHIITYQGKRMLLSTLADRKGIYGKTLFERWHKAGRPKEVPESILSAPPRHRPGCVIDGVAYSSVVKAATATGRCPNWLGDRFRALGKRNVTTEELNQAKWGKEQRKVYLEGYGETTIGELCKALPELNRSPGYFAHKWRSLGKPDVVKREMFESGRQSRGAKRTKPSCKIYLNPSYLPHIPYADLAGLSDTRNTGAGKGEIPDDVWIAMIGKRKGINRANILLAHPLA